MTGSDAFSFWRKKLERLTLNRLPTDFSQGASDASVDAITSRSSNDAEALARSISNRSITVSSKQHSADLQANVAHLAALIVLVFKLTGDTDIALFTNLGPSGRIWVLRIAVDAAKSSIRSIINDIAELVEEADQYQLSSGDLPKIVRFDSTESGAGSDAPAPVQLGFFAVSDENAYLKSTDSIAVRTLMALYSVSSGRDMRLHYRANIYSSMRCKIILQQIDKILATTDLTQAIAKISLRVDDEELLPDPRRELDWHSFRGSIQDIFTENAEKFPDRLCIEESARQIHFFAPEANGTAVPHPARSFTYEQILKASNVLASFLQRKGISRDDRVMIYAYRGADLVVAVLGILKTGATFCVLDPTYPPSRQTVYLGVAKPRTVVVIKNAGTMPLEVEEFCKSNLELITIVPALYLDDSGLLQGSEIGGADILADDQKHAKSFKNVLVGPDSNPTLSFTSGSEGKPKGVLGRHFSLTYYFDWMKKRFGLSHSDRFTMLSGIAHDPIQRDIFTPLFLGAEIIVPSPDDILPGRLAEWCFENKVTVTHLTPAMGQILSSSAGCQIPSLHHAFFVGDILTRRDCLQLQRLGRNVNVVNMYGTTETQRAVSYFEIPSLAKDPTFLDYAKDIIPAGQGMHNVQLLVVNRSDDQQICGIGEIGEIYVRAGGLAEGYMNQPDLNQRKFRDSWFVSPGFWPDPVNKSLPWSKYWKGPRDRLYRSGDLGRYSTDGNVECVGRADDQVKIRGFRIELGEINTYLSQHPAIKENITLVRRDKFEEQTLVSYFVPNAEAAIKRDQSRKDLVSTMALYEKLILNIKEYLRTKLPSYAVPSVIIPLQRMPLNPNGKIDKPALPFPDTIHPQALQRTRAHSIVQKEELTATETEVCRIMRCLLPQNATFLKGTDFYDIGGHSLLVAKLTVELQKHYALQIPLSLVGARPATAERIAADIDMLLIGDSVEAVMLEHRNEQQEGNDKASMVKSYAEDAKHLAKELPTEFKDCQQFKKDEEIKVLLTGGTGFVGVFVLRDLLERSDQKYTIYCIVRAKSPEHGLERIRASCMAYGVWNDQWISSLRPVAGDLSQKDLGIESQMFDEIANSVNVIIHNGAQVHWLDTYDTLRQVNVMSTVNVIRLCATGCAKSLCFVSSTSVLDNSFYNSLSKREIDLGRAGVLESDDLSGSAKGLSTGYGQTKWTSEYLVRYASSHGLAGSIVRPGYIFGYSELGSINVDDFLVRMLKGCVELKQVPNILNTLNAVPVEHVARVISATALLRPEILPLKEEKATDKNSPAITVQDTSRKDGLIVNVTSHPRMRFNEFLFTLKLYGYDVQIVDYLEWQTTLKKYVFESDKDSALLPLLGFVQDNLPLNTMAPELDDSNARLVLTADSAWTERDFSYGRSVTAQDMGKYIAFMVAIGYLPPPTQHLRSAVPLPDISFDEKTINLIKGTVTRGHAKESL